MICLTHYNIVIAFRTVFFIKNQTGGTLTFVPTQPTWGLALLEQISTKQLLNLLNLGPQQHCACSPLSPLSTAVCVMIFLPQTYKTTHNSRNSFHLILNSLGCREKHHSLMLISSRGYLLYLLFIEAGSTIEVSWCASREGHIVWPCVCWAKADINCKNNTLHKEQISGLCNFCVCSVRLELNTLHCTSWRTCRLCCIEKRKKMVCLLMDDIKTFTKLPSHFHVTHTYTPHYKMICYGLGIV